MTTATTIIRLHNIAPATVDIRVHTSGPHEGQLDEAHLLELVRALQTNAGDRWPVDTVYTEPLDDEPWQQFIIDAATQDSIGMLTVLTGAGA